MLRWGTMVGTDTHMDDCGMRCAANLQAFHLRCGPGPTGGCDGIFGVTCEHTPFHWVPHVHSVSEQHNLVTEGLAYVARRGLTLKMRTYVSTCAVGGGGGTCGIRCRR